MFVILVLVLVIVTKFVFRYCQRKITLVLYHSSCAAAAAARTPVGL